MLIKSLKFLGLGAGVLLAGAGMHAGASHMGGHFMHGGRGGPLEHMAQVLDLSDEQKTQIRAEIRADWPELKPKVKAVLEAHRQLADTVRSDSPSESKIRAQAEGLARSEGDLAVELSRLHQKISPILTDAQRKKCERMHDVMHRLIDDHLDMADIALGS
jgi:Spy/CpxP family protein refolding chaperone